MDKKYGIEKDVEDNNEDYIENNNEKKCQILNIDIGNGKIEQLKIYNYHNPKKDVYDFCMKNNLDYNTMEEINKQLNESIFKNINEDNNTKKKEPKRNIISAKNFSNENSHYKSKRNNNFNREKFYSKKKIKQRENTYSDKRDKNNQSKKNLFPYQINYSEPNSKQSFNISYFPLQRSNSKSIKAKKSSVRNKNTNNTTENNIFNNPKFSINNNSKLNYSEAENLLNSEIIKINQHQFGLSNLNNSENQISLSLNNNIKKPNHNSIEESIKAGNNLYNRGLKYQEEGQKKIDKIKSSLKKEEGKKSTFHPKLNKNKFEEKNRIPCTNSERIVNYKKYYENKIKKLKEKQNEEEKNNTFKPKINKNKKGNNYENEKPNNKIFLKLYEDKKVYNENLNELKTKFDKMYSYRPILNDNSKIKDPFNKRLLTYQVHSKEKLQKIKDEINKENLVKPKYVNKTISKDKNTIQNSKNENNENNPYTLMYLVNDKYKQNKKQLEIQTYSNYFSDPIINKSTDKLLENKKERAFKKIFSLLDGDEDNIIKNSAVNVNRIPKNIREILEPIFRELREENETLNENEFITVCEQIYKQLPYDKKSIMMNFAYDKKVNKKPQTNHSPKPKINSIKDGIKSKGLTLIDLNNVSRTSNFYNKNQGKLSNNSNTSNYLIQQ